MAIGRFAIRTEFGGKDGLFLKALTLYGQDIRRTILTPIEQSNSLDTLNRLWSFDDAGTDTGDKRGCLDLNTTVENAALQNDAIREQTAAYFNDFSTAATGLVERAKANGTVRAGVDAKADDEFVNGMMIAAALINRDAGDVAASEAIHQSRKSTNDRPAKRRAPKL